MNTPVDHKVKVSPDHTFTVTGDGSGYVCFVFENYDGVRGAYLNRSEVNALIGALQNAVTFEWEG